MHFFMDSYVKSKPIQIDLSMLSNCNRLVIAFHFFFFYYYYLILFLSNFTFHLWFLSLIMHAILYYIIILYYYIISTPASSTTKTDRHDIAEILLKVVLNTKNQSNQSILLFIFTV